MRWRKGREWSKNREAGSGWADPCILCREGHVKDTGLVLKAVGAIDKK